MKPAFPGARIAALVVATAVATIAVADGPVERVPVDSGLTEQTEVRRLFIDVEAVDGKGHPMPGLTKDDFKLRLNYLWRKIETVDDLCPCAGADGAQPVERDAARAEVTAREIETRWILYLEFGQLPEGARSAAVDEARRWVTEVKQPDDEAMVVLAATGPGIRELSPFTTDAAVLEAALDEAESMAAEVDPFPSQFGGRLDLCASGAVSCYYTGRKEYYQAERSLMTLLGFLTRMEAVPGRKAMLLFHLNLSMFPGRLYAHPGDPRGAVGLDGQDTALVPDLIDLTSEVGAAATVARTEVYPIVFGRGRWAVNFGANVADSTGGEHNRLASEVSDLADSAGRGCKCIYRIGVEPPSAKSRLYRVKVRINGRSLESRYKVHFLTRADKWSRTAASVLTNPEDAWDLDVAAALVPVAVRDGEWEMKVQVAVDLDDLELSTTGEDEKWEWEVGALLARHVETGTAEVHEMLGLSRLLRNEASSSFTIHERLFEGLPSGEYELRAYVRDRNGERIGGVREWISLPAATPKRAGVAGPVALLSRGHHRTESLPMRAGSKTIELTREQERGEEWLPLGLVGDPDGEELRLVSWFCPYGRPLKKKPPLVPPRRTVVGTDEDSGVSRSFPASDPDAKSCTQAVDLVDTSTLPEGSYEYSLESPDGQVGAVTFAVGAGEAGAAPGAPPGDPSGIR
jgi:hypothetical protein